jgi:capsular polysaccharide biosynthesis protein
VESKEIKETNQIQTNQRIAHPLVQAKAAPAAEEDEIDLLELLQVFRQHIVMILACFAVGLILAGGFTYFFITPQYQAKAKLYMVSASSDSIVNLTDLNLGTSLSSDYAELLVTRPVILSVIAELGLEDKYDYDALCNMLSISTIGDTRILQITVTSTDPEEAKDIANCLAEKGIEYLPEVMETSEPNMAEEAIVPVHKSSPSITKNAIMGGLVAAILCMAVLVVLFLLDDTLKDADDVEKFLGTMPLSVIPEGYMGGSDEKTKSRFKKKTA